MCPPLYGVARLTFWVGFSIVGYSHIDVITGVGAQLSYIK